MPGDGYKYKFLNKEYEDSFALNVTETDYRQYDAALGRFNVMDMMSEMAPDHTPYRYGFNNPVFWQDATGLFESYDAAAEYRKANKLFGATIEFDAGSNLWKIIDGDSVISQVGDLISKLYMMDGEMYLEQSKAGSSGPTSNSSASNSSSRGNSGNWYDFLYSENIYNFLYNNPAVTGYGSGEYGPYTGDADGISFSIGAWGSSFGVSLVLDKYNNFDWFVSYSGGAGYTGTGFSAGATFDSYNNNSSENSVLNGIAGSTYDVSGGLMVMGTYSAPFDPVTKKIINNGVERYSVGLGTGIRVGEGRTYSSGQIYQNIINYFNSFNK